MVVIQLFTVYPSRDLTNAVVRAFGLTSIDDNSPFTRKDVVARGTAARLTELRDALAEVYIPCKAAVYVMEDITHVRCLTILRHFLRAAGYMLQASDATFDGHRTQVYRIRKEGDGVVRMTRGSILT